MGQGAPIVALVPLRYEAIASVQGDCRHEPRQHHERGYGGGFGGTRRSFRQAQTAKPITAVYHCSVKAGDDRKKQSSSTASTQISSSKPFAPLFAASNSCQTSTVNSSHSQLEIGDRCSGLKGS